MFLVDNNLHTLHNTQLYEKTNYYFNCNKIDRNLNGLSSQYAQHRGNWLFCNTLGASADRLEAALRLLDWSAGMKVASFMARHREAVLNVVRSKQLSTCVDDRLMVYYMPRDEARELQVK